MHQIYENFMNNDAKIVNLKQMELPTASSFGHQSPLGASAGKSMTNSGSKKREEAQTVDM